MNDDVNHQLILPERPETREPTRTAARALAPTREGVAMTPAEMLASAVQSGANIETLERLIALQERWEAANARKAFDAAISAAKAQIPTISKNRGVGFESRRTGTSTSYRFADFGEISRVVSPILAAHGLSYRFRTQQGDKQVRVTCIVSHEGGHSEETTLQAPEDHSGNKNPIQAIGSAVTFLQRYTLTAALGLATSEDDDGKAAGGTGGDGGRINEEQLAAIDKKLTDCKTDRDTFLRYFDLERLEDMHAETFDRAMGLIRPHKKEASK